MKKSDLIVVRFGEKYRQWNAAYDAGYAAANNIPYVTLHPTTLSHMLKEVNSNAVATFEREVDVADFLGYWYDFRLRDKDWRWSDQIWG